MLDGYILVNYNKKHETSPLEPGCFNYVRKKRGINMIASMRKRGYLRTSTMVKIGMLGGMGLILFLLDFPLPIFPSFLKLDFSDTRVSGHISPRTRQALLSSF